MNDFPGKLRALMAGRELSTYAVARKVPCDPSLISRYRSGQQKPSKRLAARLDEVLGAGGELVRLAEQTLPGRRAVLAGGLLAGSVLTLDPGTLERLAWITRQPPQVDSAVVESLASMLTAQRRAEDVLGSAAMLRPVLTHLAMVEDLVKQTLGSARLPLVHIAQQWAQFGGWLCRDAGDVAGARACYGQALEWATEIGDVTMMSTVLIERGDMAAEAGAAGSVIGLAAAAARDTRAAVGQRAFATSLEARGHAMAGDATAAQRKLGDAEDLAALADGPDPAPWSYWMTPEFFQNEAGIVCGHLAGIGSTWHDRAATLLAGSPDDSGEGLWARAGTLTHLAYAHAQAGDLDQACGTAVEATALARRGGSVRLAEQLAGIHASLDARWPGDARVAELAEALR
jgi:transcriptional regulator with XRE-family HTH domain